ncbi:hypothetical protein B7943_07170, partial [Vibrio cholerae]
GRQVDGEAHLAPQHIGAVAILLVPAAKALVAADDVQIHVRTPCPAHAMGGALMGSVVDDGADALAFVHQIERFVDL